MNTELALKTEFGYSFTFKDKDVHKVLMNSGVHKVQPNGATGEEWFATDIETVKAAIKSVKNGKSTLSSSDFVRETRQETIDFREEQINAIEKTLKTFKKDETDENVFMGPVSCLFLCFASVQRNPVRTAAQT